MKNQESQESFMRMDEISGTLQKRQLSFAKLKQNNELTFENYKQVRDTYRGKEQSFEVNVTARQKRTKTESNEIK